MTFDVVYCDLSKAFNVFSHPFSCKIKYQALTFLTSCLFYCMTTLLDVTATCAVTGNTPARTWAQAVRVKPLSLDLICLHSMSMMSRQQFSAHPCCYTQTILKYKIFKVTRNISDCAQLQCDIAGCDIAGFPDCRKRNKLILNHAKTKVMSYARKTDNINFTYRICQKSSSGSV